MYYAVVCTDVPEATPLRVKHMDAHRDYLLSRSDRLIWAGARQQDDGTTIYGSFFLIFAETRQEAEDFVANDPFAKAGVFGKIEISNVRRAIFEPDLAREPA